MMLALVLAFLAGFALVLGFWPVALDNRPKLKLADDDPFADLRTPDAGPKKKGLAAVISAITGRVSVFNRPFAVSPTGRRMFRDLSIGRVRMSVEEFLLIKEFLVVVMVFVAFKLGQGSDFFTFVVLMSIAIGYMAPEMWLKARISKVKNDILRNLPDTVDLLGLCVNAGLDFMMALKYVVEKSRPTVIIDELRNMMQEINVGKPRRDALRDLAKRYELPDLSTFSRTLIQADRMGTSVTEALNILSEDMREARFRRGEAMALKAPLKMMIPLLFFIFPVVAILVAGPVFLDFFQNNPLKSLGH
ncbi:MAG: type II secretion system F family protein [Candidatus Omnitrophica bacterium]|nr:type II secretion system F family protein [Candidatus Omnitrophota bacterium]MDE2009505.1 type II secretion system F family protein [Candidatus Omnitrophota bacterium]MDE2215456.1 type II secretion system F family protein [Candidatus Omnitrophota bacterium]MDE2231626.1 type II secretion system F family protein [Candidatus Omnitrophota bacterium]